MAWLLISEVAVGMFIGCMLTLWALRADGLLPAKRARVAPPMTTSGIGQNTGSVDGPFFPTRSDVNSATLIPIGHRGGPFVSTSANAPPAARGELRLSPR